MDVREKLVKILEDVDGESGFILLGHKDVIRIADHLISGGVTVQELDGCKYCKEYEDLPEHFIDDKPIGRVFDTCIQTNENGLWHIEAPCGADIGIRFCPMCGRKLQKPPKGE